VTVLRTVICRPELLIVDVLFMYADERTCVLYWLFWRAYLCVILVSLASVPVLYWLVWQAYLCVILVSLASVYGTARACVFVFPGFELIICYLSRRLFLAAILYFVLLLHLMFSCLINIQPPD
jgi:hypothetical protein